MNIFKSLNLQFKPPQISDPDFGQITFMYISKHPERSYWEGEWYFPPTASRVFIALAGDEFGPLQEVRKWYMDLPGRFAQIIELVRPDLAKVCRGWLARELPEDVFAIIKLTGFDVEDPRISPIKWNISFETTGSKWLSITIPFINDELGDAVIDT
jgi:hypothetical protein